MHDEGTGGVRLPSVLHIHMTPLTLLTRSELQRWLRNIPLIPSHQLYFHLVSGGYRS